MNKLTIMVCLDGDAITYYSHFAPQEGDELVLRRERDSDLRVRVVGRLVVANNGGEDVTVELDCVRSEG